MGKKQLNTDSIINELQGASAFFPAQPRPVETQRVEPEPAAQEERIAQPSPTPTSSHSPVPAPVLTPVAPVAQPSVPAEVRTPVRHRHITRYAFEFYQDQIETLRAYSLQEKTLGEKGSMSEMVREALDAYIAKRSQT